MTRHLNRKAFERTFGFFPVRKLSPKKSSKAAEINQLFDEMGEKYGLTTMEVFRAAAEDLHSNFLHNVCGCPAFVLAFCQHRLAPDELARRALKNKESQKTRIAELEKELAKLKKTAP